MFIQVRDIKTVEGISQGAGAFQTLDDQTGHLFDAHGNSIAKVEFRDDESTALLADFAHDYDLELSANSISQVNPRLAAQFLSARTGGSDAPLLLDLGPSDVHIAATMPNYAAGYTNFTPMADMISPPLIVEKDTNAFWTFDRNDAFQRAAPINGAAGGGVYEISPRLSNSTYKCVARGLAGFVQTEVTSNADAPLRIEQATTRRLVDALKIEREIRVAAVVRTSGSWNSGQAITLGAGFQWNGGASSDPIKDIHGLQDLSSGEVTGIGLSGKTYRGFTRNNAVRSYYVYNGSQDGIPSADAIRATLRLPPFFICEMRYIKSDGTLDFVWGNDAVLFRNPPEMPPTSQQDVATSYTFRWGNPPAPDGTSSGGFVVRKFFLQDRGLAGGNKIVVYHWDAEVLTSKYIGGLLINAYQ